MTGHASAKSPLKLYFAIWATLLVFTFVTYKVAFIELGPFNPVVALVIATLKATLVALFFMHVWHAGERLTKLVIVSAIFFLFLLLGLTMSDYLTRGWH
ncbi:MAG TPA: cytochrome C oxidase subunit IV family protein [Candidatus Aquilonibacter sp.]|nr:cytochrome C oxidase subunit IV family protein [Candidatus Aquilonibacter sp.]